MIYNLYFVHSVLIKSSTITTITKKALEYALSNNISFIVVSFTISFL